MSVRRNVTVPVGKSAKAKPTKSLQPGRRDSSGHERGAKAVTDSGGIALRYGAFYGAANDGTIDPVRKRQFPIVGDGGGIWSWIHLDDAAAATVLALEHDGPGIYNIVDDDPAPVREWLPVLAQALGAKPRGASPPGSRGCSQVRP